MFMMARTFFILMVAVQLADIIQARTGQYEGKVANNGAQQKVKSRGFGISAWGLIFLIMAFILLAVGGYYVTIFYPLLCKRERKYDRIELANM